MINARFEKPEREAGSVVPSVGIKDIFLLVLFPLIVLCVPRSIYFVKACTHPSLDTDVAMQVHYPALDANCFDSLEQDNSNEQGVFKH